jgi:uncharacterized protein with PIN domain
MGNSATRKKAASIRQKQIRDKSPHLDQWEGGRPKFIADVMLGRLAKWLRIAGFDVLYSNKFSDDDTRLLIRKPVREFIYLESQDVQKQVRQVFEKMHIHSLSFPLTRCLSCNEALVEINRESVRRRVPTFVYQTQIYFKSCPKCGKVFWAGTHRMAVIRILEKLLAGLAADHA